MYTGYKEHRYKYGWALAVFLIPVQGSPLDSNSKSPFISLTSFGRGVSLHAGFGSLVGTVGYSCGTYEGRIRIIKLAGGIIGIGVTTLPLDNNNYFNRSDGTAFAWFSDQESHGLAASQTRGPARISGWQTEDIL